MPNYQHHKGTASARTTTITADILFTKCNLVIHEMEVTGVHAVGNRVLFMIYWELQILTAQF